MKGALFRPPSIADTMTIEMDDTMTIEMDGANAKSSE